MTTLFRSTICLLLSLFSFISLNAQGSWSQKQSYYGAARSGAVSFVIGGYAYVGLGYTGSAIKNDFYKYNPQTNSWTSIANFGGLARQNAVVFVVNDTAYVGLGDSGYPTFTKYKDFWKYDVTLNTWKKVADFGGTARTGAMAFVIGTKAYVGTGQDDTDALKDLWEYTPATNKWVKKNDITADKRKDAVGFSINGKGYLCSGWYTSPYSFILSDIQEYNPTTDTWTEKEFAAGSLNQKQWADYFILNNKAYLISGNNTNSVVVYDPATNTLSSETAFGPLGETGRSNVIAFAINNKGYAGLGIVDNTAYKNDFWQFSVPLPPAAPSNLTAEAIDNSKIKLTWKDNSNDETNFVVERSDNNNSSYVPIDTLYSNYTYFTDYTLQDSSKYFYRVRAKNNIGYSSYSNEVAVTTLALHPPKAPGNLRTEFGSLRWDDNSTNETYFLIEKSDNNNQNYIKIDSIIANNPYKYLSLPDSSGFFFRVRAKNNAGFSAYSNEVYLMTNAKAPSNFRAIPKSINEVDLYWFNQSSVETGIVIERSENDNLHYQKIDTLPTTQNTYNDRGVENGKTYYYRIAAIIRGKLVYCATEEVATPLEMGTWIKLTDFPTFSGKYGVNFYYDSIVYSGFGYSEKEFYGYSLKTKKWEKKAALGDNSWGNPISMVLKGKGFACLGAFTQTGRKKAWEYDFSANQWTQKNDVPFADRNGAIGFSLENMGYILGGREFNNYNKLLKDFYQYDITTDTWVQLADFPGGECADMPVFVYDKKAYLLLNGTDLWEYSPITNTWLKIRTLTKKIPGNIGTNLNEHFYIFNNSGSDINPMYEYNFIKDEILKKSNCPASNYSMVVVKDSTSIYAMAGYSYNNFWNYCPSMPSAPVNVTAKAIAYTKIELNWSDETDLETNYIIERAERVNYSYDYKILDTLNANSKYYLDTTVTKDKYYSYRIRAKGKDGFSEYSYSKVCKTGKPTGAYINYLTTEYNKRWVKFQPNLSSSDDFSMGIIIERSTDNINFSVIDTTNSYSVIDSLLTVGQTYYYRIRAYNNFGNSDYSQVSAIIAGSILHSSQTLQVKEGYYLDGGGLNNYSYYGNSVLILKPTNPGEKIAVDFKKFKLAYNDSLFIYDGVDTKSPLLAKFYNGMQVYKLCAGSSNTSGALTFELKSRYNSGEGWIAYVKSTALPPATSLLAKKSTGIVLTWKDNSDLETNFVIERSASDTSHFAILASPAANAVTYTDTTASPMQKYYYRIKAVYISGSSDYSNIAVSDGTILDVPQVLKNSDIILFPNPASSSCTLRMNLEKGQNLSVSLANVTGTILNTKNINMPSGPNEIPVDIDSLPAGTYFVIIKSDTDCVTKILTISR